MLRRNGIRVGIGMTPAQAVGNPDHWINDWPVQGPTDPGIRAADCWWVKNAINAQNPACVDCGRGPGLLSSSSDPEIFSKLTPEQQGWVMGAYAKVMSMADLCPPGTGTDLASMTKCLQVGYNAETNGQLPVKQLRTDGVFDEDTLCAMQLFVAHKGGAPFPDPTKMYCQSPQPIQPSTPATPTATASSGLSTGSIVGIATAGVVAIGGVVYLMSKPKRRKSRKKGR